MQTRKASIKETGEELASTDWQRFDAAVAEVRAEKKRLAAETEPSPTYQPDYTEGT